MPTEQMQDPDPTPLRVYGIGASINPQTQPAPVTAERWIGETMDRPRRARHAGIDTAALALNLRRARQDQDLTQEDLVARINRLPDANRAEGGLITAATISRYEGQKRTHPSRDHIDLIARALGLTSADLVRPSDTPAPGRETYVTWEALETMLVPQLAEAIMARLGPVLNSYRIPTTLTNNEPLNVASGAYSDDSLQLLRMESAIRVAYYRATTPADLAAILTHLEAPMLPTPPADHVATISPSLIPAGHEIMAVSLESYDFGATWPPGTIIYVAIRPDRSPLPANQWQDGMVAIATQGDQVLIGYLQAGADGWSIAAQGRRVAVAAGLTVIGRVVQVAQAPPLAPGQPG